MSSILSETVLNHVRFWRRGLQETEPGALLTQTTTQAVITYFFFFRFKIKQAFLYSSLVYSTLLLYSSFKCYTYISYNLATRSPSDRVLIPSRIVWKQKLGTKGHLDAEQTALSYSSTLVWSAEWKLPGACPITWCTSVDSPLGSRHQGTVDQGCPGTGKGEPIRSLRECFFFFFNPEVPCMYDLNVIFFYGQNGVCFYMRCRVSSFFPLAVSKTFVLSRI